MNQKQLLIYLGAGALTIGLLLYFFSNRKKELRWVETFERLDKEPFGSYFAAELLSKMVGSDSFRVITASVEESLDGMEEERGNYVFMGSQGYYPDKDSEAIKKFLEKGNKVFIFSQVMPSYLDSIKGEYYGVKDENLAAETDGDNSYLYEDSLFIEEEAFSEDTASFVENADSISDQAIKEEIYEYECFEVRNLPAPEKFFVQLQPAVSDTGFRLFSPPSADTVEYKPRLHLLALKTTGFCEQDFKVAGHFADSLINFIEIPVGEGTLYYHCQPELFTNYFMVQEGGFEYFDQIAKKFADGPIYWDKISKLPRTFDGGNEPQKSPLSFILSQESLRWAWYLLLVFGLLYLLFASKREQRIIPYFLPIRNSSIAFAQTIGRLYMAEKDHKKLIELKMKLFLDSLKSRFNLSFHQVDQQVMEKISLNGEVTLEEVDAIFKLYNFFMAKSEKVTDSEMVTFYSKLEEFKEKIGIKN